MRPILLTYVELEAVQLTPVLFTLCRVSDITLSLKQNVSTRLLDFNHPSTVHRFTAVKRKKFAKAKQSASKSGLLNFHFKNI